MHPTTDKLIKEAVDVMFSRGEDHEDHETRQTTPFSKTWPDNTTTGESDMARLPAALQTYH